MATKTREVEECEYQWAVAKAKNAEMESERLALADEQQANVAILSVLRAALLRGDGALPPDVRAKLSAQQLARLAQL